MFCFLMSFHGVITNDPKTLVLTSALQVMPKTLIFFHHQGYNNRNSIFGLLLRFDIVTDMTL